jgi:hypothetical protein
MVSLMPLAAFAQLEMNYDLLNYMASKEADPDPNDREEIQRQFKSHFIKEVFLNQVFKSDHLFYGESQGPDYDLVNQLMINQFADQLVEGNFIDLSHISLDE